MRLYGTWIVSLPDEKYTWEPDEMLGSEWESVENEWGGGSFEEWVTGIDERRFRACQVLIWFLRSQNGLTVERDKIDFKIRQLKLEQIPNPEDEAATAPSGAATSEPSPEPASDLVISTP